MNRTAISARSLAPRFITEFMLSRLDANQVDVIAAAGDTVAPEPPPVER